jgi:hypothetical protein
MKLYLLLLLAACDSALAAQNPACSKGFYQQLARYSTIKPVSSFCLSRFPPQTQTSIISTATTTTTTSTLIMLVLTNFVQDYKRLTANRTATTDTTVVSTATATEFTTLTITAAPLKVKRVPKLSTTSASSIKTATTVSQSGKPATKSAQSCPELVALQLLASNIVATACSCIISTPTVTVSYLLHSICVSLLNNASVNHDEHHHRFRSSDYDYNDCQRP